MREGEEEELPLADDVSDAPADDDACFTHHRVTHPTAVPDNVWRIHASATTTSRRSSMSTRAARSSS